MQEKKGVYVVVTGNHCAIGFLIANAVEFLIGLCSGLGCDFGGFGGCGLCVGLFGVGCGA
jgi:hypothetical protein